MVAMPVEDFLPLLLQLRMKAFQTITVFLQELERLLLLRAERRGLNGIIEFGLQLNNLYYGQDSFINKFLLGLLQYSLPVPSLLPLNLDFAAVNLSLES